MNKQEARKLVSAALCALLAFVAAGCEISAAEPAVDGRNPLSKPKRVVGVILPDVKSSARYVEQDKPLLERALGLAALEARIENAEGEVSRFKALADQMIRGGVDVLMISSLTPESGAEIERAAYEAKIPVINYDRLTRAGSADYHVSFDSTMVGQLQAEGLVKCLGDKPGARIVEFEGSPSDGNAADVAAGHHKVMGERYANGSMRLVQSHYVDGWDAELAKTKFRNILDETDNRVDGVLAANDGLGGAAIAVLKERNLVGKIQVTGQDATLAGLRSVLRGDQCMTVHKPIREEADAAARMAAELAVRDFAGADDLSTGNSNDAANNRDVKALLLSVRPVTRANIREMVTQRVVKVADLCADDLSDLCRQAGISV